MKKDNVENIYFENELYASIFDVNNISEGLDFLTSDDSYIQVGTWGYNEGKSLEPHYHNYFERSSFRTQEVVYVLEGEVECSLYKEDTTFIDTIVLKKGFLIVQFQGVHEYKILRDSKVIEIKNGPYFGPDKDRTRVNVKKN